MQIQIQACAGHRILSHSVRHFRCTSIVLYKHQPLAGNAKIMYIHSLDDQTIFFQDWCQHVLICAGMPHSARCGYSTSKAALPARRSSKARVDGIIRKYLKIEGPQNSFSIETNKAFGAPLFFWDSNMSNHEIVYPIRLILKAVARPLVIHAWATAQRHILVSGASCHCLFWSALSYETRCVAHA